MEVSYNKLFKLLIDKGMKKTVFAKKVGISQNTLAKLSKNEYVSMEILVKVCRGLECTPNDILDILPVIERKELTMNGKK
ncbi:MAG: helix-turn-helix transcriptional regulator [Erysipelotrichaceae bacterium]